MKSIVVGMGVQGHKRRTFAGTDYAGCVDPVSPEADFKSIEDVPLASFDAALALKPDYADALTNRGGSLKICCVAPTSTTPVAYASHTSELTVASREMKRPTGRLLSSLATPRWPRSRRAVHRMPMPFELKPGRDYAAQ